MNGDSPTKVAARSLRFAGWATTVLTHPPAHRAHRQRNRQTAPARSKRVCRRIIAFPFATLKFAARPSGDHFLDGCHYSCTHFTICPSSASPPGDRTSREWSPPPPGGWFPVGQGSPSPAFKRARSQKVILRAGDEETGDGHVAQRFCGVDPCAPVRAGGSPGRRGRGAHAPGIGSA